MSMLRFFMRRRLADEQGIAMVSVVGMSAILFAIAAIVMTRNISDYNQVRGDRRFEQAIQVADSGVDHTLYKVGALPSYTTGEDLPEEYKSPGADPAAEQAWVLEEVADNPLVTTPEGQWATIRPFDFDVIYSVGYVPTRANPFKIRIIRAQYDYAPFVPSTAILTNGNLTLGGNATITGAGGSVHANGNVIIQGSSVTVEGYESASGSICQGCDPTNPDSGPGKPRREVPLIDPRENYVLSEYDLCPDGLVRTGPAYGVGDYPPNSSGVPCGGTVIPGLYRGWEPPQDTDEPDPSKGTLWTYNEQEVYSGVYYIYQGSARITGNPGTVANPWYVTIFAEANPSSAGETSGDCPHVHVGGDIDVQGGADVRPHPSAQRLHLIAGRDLQMTGNPGNKWEGVYAAHEQFELRGNVEMEGVVLANDYCDTPGSPVTQNIINVGGSASLNYDGTWEIPIGRRIRTTHWNEL
jgi:hypothetical protein